MLSEISRSRKDRHFMIPLIRGILSSQTPRSREQDGGCPGLEEKMGSCYSPERKFQLCKMNKS